jgi:hypothetical protein
MTGTITSEKLRADAMRRVAVSPEEAAYWQGYRIGLTAESEHHAALLGSIGSPDGMRDARGRGYRDGRAFTGRAAQ